VSGRRQPAGAALRDLASTWSPRAAVGGEPLGPLAVLLALTAVDDLDSVAFGVLLPEIRDHFGLDLQGVLTVQAVAAPLIIVAGLGAGWLADRVRRTRLIAAGALVWACFTLLTGLAATVAVLALARAGAGIGKAVNAPAHQSLLADYYPVGNRARVFSLYSLAGSMDAWLGPLAAGFIAAAISWRAPFLVFPLLTLLAAIAAWRLREPPRGAFERIAIGVTADDEPEPPPSLAESWRITVGVRTLRRIWLALPLLVGAAIGISSLLSLYLEEVFGLGPEARGMVFFVSGAAGVAGLLVGAHLADRHLVARPQRALELVGVLAAASAVSFALIAVVPNLALYIVADAARAFASAVLAPGMFAVMSLVIPPRARSFALSAGAVFVLPGLLVLPVVGAIGDAYGLRASILAMVPVYLLGAVIVASAGSQVGPDMRSAFAAAAARLRARRDREQGGAPLLVVRALEAGRGPTQVLFGVDLDVADGEIVALAGANGAGKSTLLRCLAGLDLPSGGAVVFDGLDTTFVPADELAQRGFVYAPGGRGVIGELTVDEHLVLAAWHRDDPVAVADDRAFVLGAFPALADRLAVPAGHLSAGEQQFLTLAQAALAAPRLLLADELTFGVAAVAVPQVLDFVRALRDRGVAVVFVDQSSDVVAALADRVVTLRRGTITDGWPLPAPRGAQARRATRPEGRSVLAGEALTVRHGGVPALDAVSVDIAAGEIVGVAGANGSGKTTLLDALSGAAQLERGQVLLDGADVTASAPHVRARRGLRRVFADARLFASLTVAEAVAVAGGEAAVRRLLERVGAEDLAELRCSELSTGQRRLANLAIAFAGRPSVVLLDEPTAGVAEADAGRLATLILAARDQFGCAVVVVEHDLALLAAIADRAMRLEFGRLAAAGPPGEILTPSTLAT
jgi:branched-chain amino acid transport system ATP-binding protein